MEVIDSATGEAIPLKEGAVVHPSFKQLTKDERNKKLRKAGAYMTANTLFWYFLQWLQLGNLRSSTIRPVDYFMSSTALLILVIVVINILRYRYSKSEGYVRCHDEELTPKQYAARIGFWNSLDYGRAFTIIIPILTVGGASLSLAMNTDAFLPLSSIVALAISYIWQLSLYDVAPMLTDTVIWVEDSDAEERVAE